MSEMDRTLLERYLSGSTTPEESNRVEAWLAEDPARWSQVAALLDEGATAALSGPSLERAGDEVWTRLEGEPGVVNGLSGVGKIRPLGAPVRAFAVPPRRRFTPQFAAAVVILAVGAAAAGALLLRSWSPAPIEAVRVASTAPAERAKFRLPDGTQVILGVASTLRYPDDFGSASREVSLDGEAYFEVLHDARRPFVVHAGELVAKDVGTAFTVRSYRDDSSARVVVREGRVAIRASAAPEASERVVEPGQLGRLSKGEEPTVQLADTAALFAWTEGRLVFEEVPLRDALPQLGRWFDLEFRLADSALGDEPLSATLKSQPTPDVLNNLAASLGLRQRQAGRIVTFYSRLPTR